MTLHVHLDPLGGIAGDMFVAAVLDAWPELAPDVSAALDRCGLLPPLAARQVACSDGCLTGSRFEVLVPDTAAGSADAAASGASMPAKAGDAAAGTARDAVGRAAAGATGDALRHSHWAGIRQMLDTSALDAGTRQHAIGIFTLLARAEATVHGVELEAVTFHEVGSRDSIADIVAAATLINRLQADSWSCAALPVGGGRVISDHGLLPVPAPATSLLLDGFEWFDDGVSGERVTPTGAAILRYLSPVRGIGANGRCLTRRGYGFGSRRLTGVSNVLRATAWQRAAAQSGPGSDAGRSGALQEEIAVLEFDIDDQTSESLALGLDTLRALEPVLDVLAVPTIGKQGRMMLAIRVLTRADARQAVIDACFRQTTTLGIRCRIEQRFCLPRREIAVAGDSGAPALTVKIADRPGGATAKADISGVRAVQHSHRRREWQRSQAERAALAAQAPTSGAPAADGVDSGAAESEFNES